MKRIAIIGTGISGMAAAWLLHRQHDVTVFEKNPTIGGHSHTVDVHYDGQTIAVDTGFIVFNHRTYPHLKALFEHLKVPTLPSDMSFGVSVGGGALEYAGTRLGALFAQPSLALRPAYWRMLSEILRFNRSAPRLLQGEEDQQTLGEWLDAHKFGEYFRRYYLLPMAGAIWSCPVETMLAYPARTFVRFFHNHGLLTVTDQPQWYTVAGGSREYVKRLTAPFAERIQLNNGITRIRRLADGVALTDSRGETHHFDEVVLAAHGDQCLRLIENPTLQEQQLLSAFTYQPNIAWLHRDPALMPKRRKAWASWVYLSDGAADEKQQIAVTYWMNSLQQLPQDKPLFVTLNPRTPPRAEWVFGEYHYEHPVFDEAAVAAQARIGEIQGVDRLWFCGAWQRYGFHEDGLMSAIALANRMGIEAPWQG